MLETNPDYKALFELGAIEEYKITIGGIDYTDEVIYDTVGLTQKMFATDTLSVGGFVLSTLKAKLKIPTLDIPRNGTVQFYYRLNNQEVASDWVKKFDGRITKRKRFTDEVTSIEAIDKGANYDRFLDIYPEDVIGYPADNRYIAELCATHLGFAIENIEDVYDGSSVEYPNELTIVGVLQNIAAISGGNWHITEKDNLKLIIPKYTPSVGTYAASNIIKEESLDPISRVTMYYRDDNAFTAGDDTGSEIIIDTAWATQGTTDYVLSVLQGLEYLPMEGVTVRVDPAIQLGDTFEYSDGSLQLATQIDYAFGGSTVANVTAPINNESSYDDPWKEFVNAPLKRKVTLGDSYQGVTIGRENGIEMLLSPDGSEENAIARYYADIYRGLAFQYRDTPEDTWQDWLYFDTNDKVFKLMLSEGVDMGSKVVQISADLDGITKSVEALEDSNINIIYNLSMTVGDYYGWDWEDTESIPLVLPLAYKFNLQYGTNFEIVNVLGSLSKKGQSFFNNGKALSPYGYVRGGVKYSARFKIAEGHGIKIEVREYNKEKELIHSRIFDFEGLGFHELSIITKEATNFVRLVYIVEGVSISKRVIVADSTFNRGEPRNWEDTPNEFEFWTRSQILQLSDSISSTVENLIIVDGKTQSNKSSIEQTAEQIELKVSKDNISSTINTTAQGVMIDASKINLTGYATFASLEGNGTTTIDGSNINTGVLKSNNGKTKLDLDGGTFLIGDSPSNYEMYYNGSTLALGGNTTISWANIGNKPYIPSPVSDEYITTISRNAITTEFLNARNITAQNLDSGTINIGNGQFTVNTSGWLTAGGGGFSVPPNADGITNSFGGYARWKLDNSNYILQGTDRVSFFFSGVTGFRFNKDGTTNFSMQMGNLESGVTMSVGDSEINQLQIRNATNEVYMDIASSDFVISSSQEFKQEIKPTKTKLDMVKNTEVFDFEYKEPTGEIELFDGKRPQMMSRAIRDNPKKIGFIAEKSPNEMVMPLKEGEIGVSMTNTVGILWKAVQELSAEVDKLKEGK